MHCAAKLNFEPSFGGARDELKRKVVYENYRKYELSFQQDQNHLIWNTKLKVTIKKGKVCPHDSRSAFTQVLILNQILKGLEGELGRKWYMKIELPLKKKRVNLFRFYGSKDMNV